MVFSGGYIGIDYEKIRVDRSTHDAAAFSDAWATIGYYLAKLGTDKKLFLAFSFKDQLPDREIAIRMNKKKGSTFYTESIVKSRRNSGKRQLDKFLREAGLITQF